MKVSDFSTWMKARQAHFEQTAREALPAESEFPESLHRAMRWSVLEGGKRVRPLLCYAAAEVTRASEEAADDAALALECIHSYSLVHDDLPCMDNDMLRHGKPSTHAKFGFAEAVLAGDALQALAFEILARGRIPADRLQALVRTLSESAGSRGMCGGQAVDLALTGSRGCGVPMETLRKLHAMKTGALIRGAVLMGAEAGDPVRLTPEVRSALVRFGDALGLAFQVTDDILDVTGDAATLGKTAGKDEAEEKPTYVSLLGLEGAKALAEQTGREALAALAGIEAIPGYEGTASRLACIAEFVVKRDR